MQSIIWVLLLVFGDKWCKKPAAPVCVMLQQQSLGAAGSCSLCFLYSGCVEAFNTIWSDVSKLQLSAAFSPSSLHPRPLPTSCKSLWDKKHRSLFCLAFSGPLKLTSSPQQNFFTVAAGVMTRGEDDRKKKKRWVTERENGTRLKAEGKREGRAGGGGGADARLWGEEDWA